MFSKAHLGRVWTTIEFQSETDAGESKTVSARFLIQPLPRREYQARRKAQMKSAETAVAAVQVPKPGADVSVDEAARLQIERLIANLDASLAATEADVELLAERTHDWRLQDEEGNPVEFDRGYLRDLLSFDLFYVPFAQRFGELCTGAVRKN